MNKILGLGLVVVAAIALVVLYASHNSVQLGTSPQGSTGSTARQYNVYGVNLASAGTNATSSSILNSTGNDLYVTAIKAGCEGVGSSPSVSSLTLSVSTTSTAAPAAVGTNLVGGSALTIATATPRFVAASSTVTTGSGSALNIWPAATYMTFQTNATNTAVCTFGVDAFSS